MSALENSLFSLKFTAKQLSKQSNKASKDEQKELEKLKKALQKGNTEGAKIYASNAIRKKNESLNLLRLSSRIDAVTSRVQTAVTMRAVTGSMGKVVQGMDVAMKTMDLERISAVMDKFESQFTDLDVQTSYMEDTMNDSTANTTPQEQVDLLLQKVADEAGIEVQHDLAESALPEDKLNELNSPDKVTVEEDRLAERLRALRPQAS
ncbi:putative DID2-class E vacuolar-protein sorting and endocytosis factor [Cystobasidium minutum MCA 4210]|uniref:putative DID2-class E vacuolar-protein sorting and endocytosis factor n=1 Tax=Cystobasidium minutum MCA 4210 TaxID=1397322 RepID=UPI0034CF8A0D|eukprot:jgi/Rhomi1/168736/fgenesh1_kg.3_\